MTTDQQPRRRALAVMRVSSDEQVEGGFSMAAQRRAIRAYAEAYGMLLVDEIAEEAISGFNAPLEDRPGLVRALELAERGAIDVLITHKVDRLSRNLRMTLDVIHRLRATGVAYLSVAEGIDFSTPVGEIVLAILASFAQYYSKNLAAESRKGKLERMRQGQSLGRPPLGYHFTPVVRPERRRPPAYGGAWSRIGCDCADRASWTVCAPGAALVRRIFDEYSTGTVSACDLVARLNADRPQLRRWQRDTVLYILKNPIYRGTVRDALTGDTYPGRHPAIIDSEEFDHVQVVLARRRMERRRVASLGRAYPLQGLLHCAGCGQRMRAVSMWRRRPDGSVAIYDSYAEWNRRIRGIECAAPQVQLTALIPDGQIRDILATIPIGRRVDDLDVDVGAPMAADLDRRRARLDERLRRVNRMYEMGTIAEEEYEERVAGVRRERSQLEAAPRRPPIELVRLALERLRLCNLVGGDRATIRDLVRLVLERVDFDTGARRVVALRGTFGAAPLLRTSPALRETEPGVFVPDPPLAPGPRPRALGGVKPPGPALRLRATTVSA